MIPVAGVRYRLPRLLLSTLCLLCAPILFASSTGLPSLSLLPPLRDSFRPCPVTDLEHSPSSDQFPGALGHMACIIDGVIYVWGGTQKFSGGRCLPPEFVWHYLPCRVCVCGELAVISSGPSGGFDRYPLDLLLLMDGAVPLAIWTRAAITPWCVDTTPLAFFKKIVWCESC